MSASAQAVDNSGPLDAPQSSVSSPTDEHRPPEAKKLFENAKTAARTAIEILGVVAEMTEGVPYLGTVSKALTAFMKALDEIDACRESCRAALKDAKEFEELIRRFKTKWTHLEGGGENDLRLEFAELARAILECLETLQALKVDSQRLRDRARLYLKKNDIRSCVSKCQGNMKTAKEKFSMAVALDTYILVREIHERSQPATVSQIVVPTAHTKWRLRSATAIFHGRKSEVKAAVDLIVTKAPARVAILGPGGIGKTSIALAVLHDVRVKKLYGNHRCFMSCEATTTADAAVRALADALHVVLEESCSAESARDRVLLSLTEVSGIVCFDNLETPLDADKRAVEDLLNDITALPSVALLITSRDKSIPTLKWTSPRLTHIEPFSRKAALATWDDICDLHDEYTMRLVRAVDRMPLAVTLLARLASIEQSPRLVWNRWEAERTDMIHDGDRNDRLYSVGASIELSLRDRAEAAALLGIICMCLPYGVWDDRIGSLDGLKDRRESVASCLTLLKKLSLVYTESVSWDTQIQIIRVLSPIRHHMLQHHVSDELFLKFTDIAMANQYDWLLHYRAIMTVGWKRPGCRERCVQMVISCPVIAPDNIELLSQAIGTARELDHQIQLQLHRQLGRACLYGVGEFEKARSSFSKVIELDGQLGDRKALFEDWKEWILTFRVEFRDPEDECRHLEEVQNAIQNAWDLGRNESGVWNHNFLDYWMIAKTQHYVNEGRRKLHMHVIHRSGLYSNNDSTACLDYNDIEHTYNQLVSMSSPPWDLSSILDTVPFRSFDRITRHKALWRGRTQRLSGVVTRAPL
ncbi:hypothetical protein PENSPDRAFT_691220 [Peniophora sp. CONT]|nr:hypothetical protein PENSPDRAFT_691220 [Peniophora sp. CONT]